MSGTTNLTRQLTVSAVCVLGSLALPAVAAAGERTMQIAASDSIWCRMFPTYCGDQSTPGGVQNAPTPAGDHSAPSEQAPSADMPAGDVSPVAPPPSPPPANADTPPKPQ